MLILNSSRVKSILGKAKPLLYIYMCIKKWIHSIPEFGGRDLKVCSDLALDANAYEIMTIRHVNEPKTYSHVSLFKLSPSL